MESLHQTGDVVGDRYRVVALLGQGGVATTYEAEDIKTYHHVALKAVSLRGMGDWKVLELFEREAKVLQTIDHPQIPDYLDYFHLDTDDDRRFYIVQELAEGRSLAELVESGWRTQESGVKDIALQILNILNYLHWLTPPVIHRDIKPRNIIRRTDGSLYLVDFGAVRAVSAHTFTRSSGTFVGTFGYMPPEQFRGKAYFASDLYSLGATLLYVLTGRSPSDLPQTRMKIDFRDCVSLSSSFADWLDKMLEPAVEDRFHSAQEAMTVLQVGQTAHAPTPERSHSRSDLDLEISRHSNAMQRRSPPAGTRVQLQHNHYQLVLHVPPNRLGCSTFFLFGFALFWNGFIFLWTAFAVLTGAPLFFVLFSVPFWLAGLFLIGSAVFSWVGYRDLEFTPQTFRLAWRCLAWKGKIEGETANITRVSVEMRRTSKGGTRYDLTLWEGIKQRVIVPELTPVEKEWLAAEITDFLAQVRR